MISLTYERLITYNPFFYSEILAGWKGKQHACHHVTFEEETTISNSLLLIDCSSDAFSTIEQSIEAEHISGIILYGHSLYDVPSYILEEANEKNKPLIRLKHIDGQTIYDAIQEIFLLQKSNLLSIKQSELSTYWLHLYNENDIQTLWNRLSEIIGRKVTFLNNQKQLVSSLEFSSKEFTFVETTQKNIDILTDGQLTYFAYQIIDTKNQLIGYFLLDKQDREIISEEELHILGSITPTMCTWMKQEKLTQNIHLKYKDQFLFDILNNNIETESELIQLGRLLEMQFLPNTYVLATNLNSDKIITKEIISNMESILIRNKLEETHIYTTHLSHRIVAIVVPKSTKSKLYAKAEINEWLQSIQHTFSELYPFISTFIGIGRTQSSILDLHISFQEAKIALQMHNFFHGTNSIIHYNDLGYIRLLSYIHHELLDDFASLYLGKLQRYDNENGTDLIQTLYTYCNQNGDIFKTANLLFIHPNTLRQRLKKIESILQIQLDQYTDLVNIILALKISIDMNI
ncbi:PucR family transcriptional regulator [Bacillus massiliigorillae]|uniref:PucR family transcriptional regulator n=1 Tax=Bacillus massiliigorillae TaxID=1243664 RepID=UPI000399E3FB|nr:helix-turn-helix domain-containing protein [Bacillus massiliigorillae]